MLDIDKIRSFPAEKLPQQMVFFHQQVELVVRLLQNGALGIRLPLFMQWEAGLIQLHCLQI